MYFLYNRYENGNKLEERNSINESIVQNPMCHSITHIGEKTDAVMVLASPFIVHAHTNTFAKKLIHHYYELLLNDDCNKIRKHRSASIALSRSCCKEVDLLV